MTRDEIAAMALQGLLANPNIDTLETMVNDAVIASDLLIHALGDSTHSPTSKSLARGLSIGITATDLLESLGNTGSDTDEKISSV